jgi:hypothetical protein
MYENRRMEHVQIVLRRGGRERRENNGGGKSKIY